MPKFAYRLILATGIAASIPLLAVAAASRLLQVPIGHMTRDIAAVANVHPLTGVLSSLGIVLWAASATVWLFAAYVQRARQPNESSGLLVLPGLLSAYLAIDDLFEFHELIAPRYLGVPEEVTYALLGAAVGVYLWRYRERLRERHGELLLLALASLAASVGVDAGLDVWLWRLGEWVLLIEDGFKWLGICFWTEFAVVGAAAELGVATAAWS
jgi:hypothetical protein